MDAVETGQREVVPPEPVAGKICGFWRRTGAFVVDMVLLGLVTGLLTPVLVDTIGDYLRASALTAGVLGFLYFAVLGSELNQGQTLGMYLAGIRVVNLSGRAIPFSRSVVRAGMLCLALSPAQLVKMPGLMLSPFGVVLYILAGTLLAGSTYLIIFNRRNRQTLHDLAGGSFVVHSQPRGPVTNTGISKIHWCFLPLICLAALIASSITSVNLRPVASMFLSLKDVPNATPYAVNDRTYKTPRGRVRIISVVMTLGDGADPRQVAHDTACRIQRRSSAEYADAISVRLQQDTADYGLLSSTHVFTASAPPDRWKESEPVPVLGRQEYRILFLTLGYNDK